MKTRKKIMIVCVLSMMLTASLAIAQTYTPEKENNTNGTEVVLQGQNVSPEVLGIFTAPNPRNGTIQGNAVFLRQIGDFNTASIRTRTNASEINLVQNGHSNNTEVDYTANTAIADLVQDGDFNTIKDYANSPGMDISLDLVQEGNDLKFERQGVNELTKSIKFKQTQASPTLIVRSVF